MKTQPTPESILQDLVQIQRLDRGSVSVIRPGPAGPYYLDPASNRAWEVDLSLC